MKGEIRNVETKQWVVYLYNTHTSPQNGRFQKGFLPCKTSTTGIEFSLWARHFCPELKPVIYEFGIGEQKGETFLYKQKTR